MKAFDSGLAAHYASGNTTLASFIELTRRDGGVLRFTSATSPVVVSGDTYLPAGLDVANLSGSADLAVDASQLTIFPDGDVALEADLVAGLWDFAAFRIFETSYVDPTIGINLLRRGWTGEVDTAKAGYTVELRSLKQALQQNLGAVTSKTCRYRLGSTSKPDGLCLIDLAPFTHTYAVTAVASPQEFTCSAATEAADYYGEGSATALDGDNVNYAQKVKAFLAGVFTLALPMPFDVQIGDTFSFVAGCRKRWDADCRDKFSNILNFGGEKDVPGSDVLLADPTVSV